MIIPLVCIQYLKRVLYLYSIHEYSNDCAMKIGTPDAMGTLHIKYVCAAVGGA